SASLSGRDRSMPTISAPSTASSGRISNDWEGAKEGETTAFMGNSSWRKLDFRRARRDAHVPWTRMRGSTVCILVRGFNGGDYTDIRISKEILFLHMNMSVAPNGGHGAGSALISVLRSRRMTSAPDEDALVNLLSRHAEPLPAPDDEDFGRAFDRFGDARVVLIGEASHGTYEFYQARAAISRRLIEHHGFSIVAVEADWPDAAQLDAWVRARTEQDWRQDAFRRFPLWMWRNREVAAFSEWLRAFNRNSGRPVEFRGLDVYRLSASLEAVLC